MLTLAIYALAVFAFSLACILLWRRWYWAIAVVVLAATLGPLVMRAFKYDRITTVDPYWISITAVHIIIALIVSMVALGISAAIDRDREDINES